MTAESAKFPLYVHNSTAYLKLIPQLPHIQSPYSLVNENRRNPLLLLKSYALDQLLNRGREIIILTINFF